MGASAFVGEPDFGEQRAADLRRLVWAIPFTILGPLMTLPIAVMCGNRLKCWYAMPVAARKASSSRSLCLVRTLLPNRLSRLLTRICPAVEFLEQVDAPQPGLFVRAARPDHCDNRAARPAARRSQYQEGAEVQIGNLDHRLQDADGRH
jgi:hypothetical protein